MIIYRFRHGLTMETRNRPDWAVVFMRALAAWMRTVYDLSINKGAHCFRVQWRWWDASEYKAPLPFGPLVISSSIYHVL